MPIKPQDTENQTTSRMSDVSNDIKKAVKTRGAGNGTSFSQELSVLKYASDGKPIYNPELFLNYELSLLKFNWRVLNEAVDERTPVLERVKFIGIVASNLDEFFQKRVGGLKRQLQAGVHHLSVDGMTPMEQLKEIRTEVKKMIRTLRGTFFDKIVPNLAEAGIRFKSYSELTDTQRVTIDDYFNRQLYPILTPLVVDQSHPFPLISNKSRSFAIEIMDKARDEMMFARLKIPSNRPRWLTAANNDEEGIVLVLIDDVIQLNMGRLFPGALIKSAHVFRVTRNADMERNEEEAEDLLELIEEELRERRFAEVVRLEVDANMPKPLKDLLMENMGIGPNDVFEIDGAIGLADTMELYKLKVPKIHRYPVFVPTLHPVFRHEMDESVPDIFSIIRKGDFLVHHPYHSFATSVQRFVEEAAADPKVLAIKQTLYRTSSDSPLMHALMRAAQDGKQVAMLVELKARFDEERNIVWAQKLEKAGVHVAYGLAGLKIHTKLTMVVREETDGLRTYVHIGTGNYHPGTAQLYEDIGLFTCDEILSSDVTDLFNFLTGFAPGQQYRKLMVAPHYMRNRIAELIRFETDQALAGREARIIFKVNNLEDPEILSCLYEASKAGVSIDCIARSVCRLRPGVPGLSENIRVHSIVGRYLEHSRLLYFHHNGEHKYLIGSADMMHRNLDARVEAITPVEAPALKEYLRFVLQMYLQDNRQRWMIDADGNHRKIKTPAAGKETAIQDVLMNHAQAVDQPVPKAF